jgi:hypothetical protein
MDTSGLNRTISPRQRGLIIARAAGYHVQVHRAD